MSTPQQPTKKERREAARTARVEAEQAEAAKAQRQKRLLVILGGVAAVVVIAVVLIVTTSGNDSTKVGKDPTATVKGVPEMNAMLKGETQNGIQIGNPKAPVKVVEFIDAQCPICQEYANNVFPTINQDYISTGKILYETRTLHFLDNNFGTTDSQRGAQWLNAAGFQNKMYNAIALLYSNHGEEGTKWITPAYLTKISAAIPGLNVKQVMTQMNSARAKALVSAADALGTKYNVSGTPTVLVGKNAPGATLTQIQANSVTDPSEYKAGIDAALKINGGGTR